MRLAAPKAGRSLRPRHTFIGSIQPGRELPLPPNQPAGFISAQAPYRACATTAPFLVAADFLAGFPERTCPRAKEIGPTMDFTSVHCFTGLVAAPQRGKAAMEDALHTAD